MQTNIQTQRDFAFKDYEFETDIEADPLHPDVLSQSWTPTKVWMTCPPHSETLFKTRDRHGRIVRVTEDLVAWTSRCLKLKTLRLNNKLEATIIRDKDSKVDWGQSGWVELDAGEPGSQEELERRKSLRY